MSRHHRHLQQVRLTGAREGAGEERREREEVEEGEGERVCECVARGREGQGD